MKTYLDQLQTGECGKILNIHAPEGRLRRKLMNLGFFPGSEICVMQSRPAYLIEVGFTQIALDVETCRLIQVAVGAE